MPKTKSSNFPTHDLYVQTILPNHLTIPHVWMPGNVPSSKNSKQIVSIPSNRSACCNAPILEERIDRTHKRLICSACHKICIRTTYPKLINSSTVQAYVKEYGPYFMDAKKKNLWKAWTQDMPKPWYMGMYFIRERDNAWDFNNASQIICDLMKEHNWVEDDSVRDLIPVYLGHHKNAERPGLILMALRDPLEMTKQMLNYTYEYYRVKQSQP